jgi:hypothetical protein
LTTASRPRRCSRLSVLCRDGDMKPVAQAIGTIDHDPFAGR